MRVVRCGPRAVLLHVLVRALPVAVLAALKVSVVALVLGAEAATAAVLAAGLACVVVALGARAGR